MRKSRTNHAGRGGASAKETNDVCMRKFGKDSELNLFKAQESIRSSSMGWVETFDNECEREQRCLQLQDVKTPNSFLVKISIKTNYLQSRNIHDWSNSCFNFA